MKPEEYSSLRTEILQEINGTQNYKVFLYTITITIFGFSFNNIKNIDTIIFMLPVLITIFIQNICNNKLKAIIKISSYIIVFAETNTYEWEKRAHKFNHLENVEKNFNIKSEIVTYIFNILWCFFFLLYSTLYVKNKPIINVLIGTIITIISICYVVKNRINTTKLREDDIKFWRIIRESEKIQ